MKAIVYDRYGDADVLHLTEWEAPVMGVGQVLIDVEAVAVAPGDCKTRAGALHHFHPQTFPKIPGRSGVGTIAAVHSEVDGYRPGDRVFFSTPHAGQGCCAERIALDATSLAIVPAELDAVAVAAVAHSAVCAWRALVDYADLQAGQSLLILGGSGVVGMAAIELAASIGATITVSGSARYRDEMMSAGATIVWTRQQWLSKAQAYRQGHTADTTPDETAAGPRRFDCVFDLVGGETHQLASDLLKPGGKIVYLRAAALPGNCVDGSFALTAHAAGDAALAYRACVDVSYTPALMSRVLALVARRVLTPRIALALPWLACAEAHRRVEAGGLDGRVVLRVHD